MGRFSEHSRFRELLSLLRSSDSVAGCLYYPGMAEVPEGYDRFAHRDAKAMDAQWQDVCPAYALALVSHRGYRLPDDDAELEILWDELGSDSSKRWDEVRDLVLRAWRWLGAETADHQP